MLEFILNVEDISGTKVHHYLKLAVSEQSPQIYRPREGKVNFNFNKFNRIQLEFIVEYTYKFLRLFNYYDIFLAHGAKAVEDTAVEELNKEYPNADNYIARFNESNLKHSI